MQNHHVRELGFGQHGKTGGKTDKGTKGGEVQQAQHPQVTAFEYRQLLTERRFGGRQIVHTEPGRQRTDQQERYPNPGGVLQPQ
ncbi:hypothetical protein D3C73_1102670 [compost metagenome]